MSGDPIELLHRYWTAADLEALPDDDYRYECIEGVLVVTPARSMFHQLLSDELVAHLRPRVAAHERVISAPGVTVPAALGGLFLIPDLVVANTRERVHHYQMSQLRLAVEIVSPSTALRDRSTKLAVYSGAGVPWYLLVDTVVESLVLHSVPLDGQYETRQTVRGSAAFGRQGCSLLEDLSWDLLSGG